MTQRRPSSPWWRWWWLDLRIAGRVPVVSVVWLLLISAAYADGQRRMGEWERTSHRRVELDRTRRAAMIATVDSFVRLHGASGLRRVDAPPASEPWVLGAMIQPVPLPVAPLGTLAGYPGRTGDLILTVGTWQTLADQDTDSELPDPFGALTDRFDVLMLVALLLPLALILVLHDVVAADRALGNEAVLAVMDARGVVLRRRVLIRAGPVVLPAVLVVWLADASAGWARCALWTSIVLLHAGGWMLLCLWRSRRSAVPASVLIELVGGWVMLAFLVPSLTGAVASLAMPVPASVAAVVDARAIQARAEADRFALLRAYRSGPPPATADSARWSTLEDAASQMVALRVVDRELAMRQRAVLTAVEHRRQWRRVLGILSPVALVHDGLSALAGIDGSRHLALRTQLADYQQARRSDDLQAVVHNVALDGAALRARPPFRFVEPRTWRGEPWWWSALFLWCAAAGFGWWRTQRAP